MRWARDAGRAWTARGAAPAKGPGGVSSMTHTQSNAPGVGADTMALFIAGLMAITPCTAGAWKWKLISAVFPEKMEVGRGDPLDGVYTRMYPSAFVSTQSSRMLRKAAGSAVVAAMLLASYAREEYIRMFAAGAGAVRVLRFALMTVAVALGSRHTAPLESVYDTPMDHCAQGMSLRASSDRIRTRSSSELPPRRKLLLSVSPFLVLPIVFKVMGTRTPTDMGYATGFPLPGSAKNTRV
mmetsp:Transcript_51174/g.128391  ORF Transcript_51174/g.128391 Transcript_51174/m.128391 type:complete len:239 (+) Transcript_51174:4525-5241(+)